ncbi:hypothetical protein DSLASN_48020 [Desulfoluna limicola]|uniref:AsmA domain-containing protein n=1 Tax=Desulfoluna limicola TaxID=2810562 RepID=A0ABN6FDZ7_9BACT|nr:hypothetical protein DSLASN_48020 [Desulfoluna limicola]
MIINIDSIAHTQINKALKSYLPGGGSLKAIDFQLAKGYVAINGLIINSPQVFGPTPLLQLERLELDIKPTSLLSGERVVEQVVLKDVSIVVIRTGDGELNVLNILTADKRNAEPDAEAKETYEGSEPPIPSVRINATRFENIRIAFIDQGPPEPWSTELRLDLTVDDLQLRDLMNIDILSGKILLALSTFKAASPSGFGDETLASLERLVISSDGLDLGAPEMVIDNILIKEPSLSLTLRRDGVSNWQCMGGASDAPEKEAVNAEATEEKPAIFKRLMDTLKGRLSQPADRVVEAEPSESSKTELPVIVVKRTRLEGGSFTYRNDSLTKEGIVLTTTDIQAEVTGLRLFDTRVASPPASVSLSFELGQPQGHPAAYLGLLARVGLVGVGAPLINTQLRVTGFKLDTLGSLVPHATQTLLGASGLDADIALAINTDSLHLNAAMLTDKNVQYNAINIKGPLDAPRVEMDKILNGVFNRFSSGLLDLGKGGVHAGVDIASGGVEVTKGLGSGLLQAGKSVLKGIQHIGTGVVTLNKKKVKEGLKESSVNTLVVTVDSAKKVGATTGHGLTNSYSNLKGDARLEAWNKDIPARHDAAMQRAQSALNKMPYPPVAE